MHDRIASIGVAVLIVALTIACAAQTAATQDGKPAQIPAETLHEGTQLVVLDVVVQDRDGHPVHGLKPENFVVTEQKKPQTVQHFEEHSGVASQKAAPPLPALPPGIFTDYTPVPAGSALNVLLVDTLNTPMKDQVYVRQQLLDYVKHEKPGTRVAIFGLTTRLVMLQGFTSDPAVLQAAVQHKLVARASTMLDDPMGSGTPTESLSETMQANAPTTGTDASYMEALADVQQFEAEQESFQVQMRQQYTLDAFNALAHYLSNFPGRKNLLWFSGSFPLEIEPDPTLNDAFSVMEDSNQEFRETTNLLTMSQVAVYPIDARGLMTAPMFDAANSGSKYVRSPTAFAADAAKFSQAQAAEHGTMEEMASDTGGQAFYNTNGLWQAAAKAIDAGANYYTLAYNPGDRNWNGAYRNIHVQVAGALAAQGYKLAYRHGYYADDPQKPQKPPKRGELPAKGAPAAPTPATLADHAREAYSRAAISRGAPAPSDILFKVRIVPLTGKDEAALAPENQPDPHGRMKAPYRTFAVDYVALPSAFSMTAQSDGRHTGAIEFTVFVYDTDGELLNVSGKQVELNLSPEMYKRFITTPVRFQLLVSAPVKQESYLRVMIHDVPTNHYGAVEVPATEVGRLPALQAQATAGAAKPGAATAQQPGQKQ